MDFLIANPVRTVALHKGGISVRVPAPERYAVHKLIVASRRRTGEDTQVGYGAATANLVSKRDKDVRQASLLVEALALKRRQYDLAAAWTEAWRRGPAWREGLNAGRALMAPEHRDLLADAVRQGCLDQKVAPADVGF
ncbi:MAG: GSU2403 family nucleotidyltransferase fold protein [Magnetospirillum sp.]|nr:GSU2403 family nucleotidyltransferase fold protein [Magnetospirillum sp.]